jgi:hypothetical protein
VVSFRKLLAEFCPSFTRAKVSRGEFVANSSLLATAHCHFIGLGLESRSFRQTCSRSVHWSNDIARGLLYLVQFFSSLPKKDSQLDDTTLDPNAKKMRFAPYLFRPTSAFVPRKDVESQCTTTYTHRRMRKSLSAGLLELPNPSAPLDACPAILFFGQDLLLTLSFLSCLSLSFEMFYNCLTGF